MLASRGRREERSRKGRLRPSWRSSSDSRAVAALGRLVGPRAAAACASRDRESADRTGEGTSRRRTRARGGSAPSRRDQYRCDRRQRLPWLGLEAQSGTGGDHWRPAGVDGGDDLGVVDPLQVGGRDAEVGMPQLALDDVERDAFVGEFDRGAWRSWWGAKRRRTPAFEATRRSWARAESLAQGRPRVRPSTTHSSGPTGSAMRSSSQGRRCSQRHGSMPTSRRRPPLPWRTSTDPVPGSRSRSVRASASLMRSPARQSNTTSARIRAPWTSVAGLAHDSDDLLDRGRVRRIAQPPVARRPAGEVAGQGDQRAAATGGVQQRRCGHGLSSPWTTTSPRTTRSGRSARNREGWPLAQGHRRFSSTKGGLRGSR
jgi:hypothetical protein